MGRHTGGNSYGFRIKRLEPGWYRIAWTVDFYYPSSRLRHPRSFSRDTDTAGAVRFAKRHGIEFVPNEG